MKFQFSVNKVWTSSSDPTYPYKAVPNSNPLLASLGYLDGITLWDQLVRHWWTISQTQVPRNVAHLLTGKKTEFLGAGPGSGAIENPNDMTFPTYLHGVSFSTEHTKLASIITHEIGHNLGAKHEPLVSLPSNCECSSPYTASVMCQTIEYSQTIWFCPYSFNEILTFLNANFTKLRTICGSDVVCYSGNSFQLNYHNLSTVYWTVTGPYSFSTSSNVISTTGNPVTVYRTGTSTSIGSLSARSGSASGPVIASMEIIPCMATLSGPTPSTSLLCSGSSITLTANNAPLSYDWNKSSNISLSGSGSSRSATWNGSNSGPGWVSISLNSTEIAKYNITYVGVPIISSITGPTSVIVGGNYQYYANSVSGSPTSYYWYINNSTSNIYSYGTWASANFYYEATYSVSAQAANSCGTGVLAYLQPIWAYYYSPSPPYPNPTSDVINIEVGQNDKSKGQTNTYDIRLLDIQGNLLRQTFTKGGTVEFNVSNLPDGVYYLHIYDGVSEKPEIHQIMVEH